MAVETEKTACTPVLGRAPNSEFKGTIVWPNLLGFLLMHIIAIYGWIYHFKNVQWITFLYGVVMTYMASAGITVGAHRLYSHRSYKAVWGLRLVLVILQTMAGQNCLYIWVRDHRQHHKYSDTDADPHNSGRGFFFSHIGWLMMRKHPDVLRLGATIDMSDMEADPFVMFQKKYYKILYIITKSIVLCLPMLWGESLLDLIILGLFSADTLHLNITWSVNSWAHFFGTRPYNKNIPPANSGFVGYIAFGEGWHNYHHCFPWDYRASEFPMGRNWNTKVIEFCARRGWAYDLRAAPESMIRERVLAQGDGSHPVWGAQASELHDTHDHSS